jgi:hypothetical protein
MATYSEATYEAGEAFDRYGATVVPLRTPLGPVTLTITDGTHIHADSGYITSEYGAHAHLNDDGEAFTWRGAEVIGSAHLYIELGWLPRTGHEYGGMPRLSKRTPGGFGRDMTAQQSADIVGYWSAVATRYVADHPDVLAHAAFRAAVLAMGRKAAEIKTAEAALSDLRKESARLRRKVRATFAAGYRTTTDIWPYPDHDSSYASGYVIELDQDAQRRALVPDPDDEQDDAAICPRHGGPAGNDVTCPCTPLRNVNTGQDAQRAATGQCADDPAANYQDGPCGNR